jgi:hypothetical protein
MEWFPPGEAVMTCRDLFHARVSCDASRVGLLPFMSTT